VIELNPAVADGFRASFLLRQNVMDESIPNTRWRVRQRRERYWRDTRVAEGLRGKEQVDEDVFFRGRDRELLRRISATTDEKRRDYVRELAHMRCPECGRLLAMVPYLGVRVAECPERHGMWLTEEERHILARRERHSWLSRYLYRPGPSNDRFPPSPEERPRAPSTSEPGQLFSVWRGLRQAKAGCGRFALHQFVQLLRRVGRGDCPARRVRRFRPAGPFSASFAGSPSVSVGERRPGSRPSRNSFRTVQQRDHVALSPLEAH